MQITPSEVSSNVELPTGVPAFPGAGQQTCGPCDAWVKEMLSMLPAVLPQTASDSQDDSGSDETSQHHGVRRIRHC